MTDAPSPARGERPDALGVTFRRPRSRAVLWAGAMLWNVAGIVIDGKQPLFALVGALAALFFGYFAARVLFGVTTASFAGGMFRVATGPLPPFARFEHPISDIHGFVAAPDDEHEREGFAVFLVTRGSGARFRLPLPLAGAQLHSRGAKTPLFSPVTYERAALAAAELEAALDEARHASSSYRVLDVVAPHVRVEPVNPGDVDGNDERTDDGDAARRITRTRRSP